MLALTTPLLLAFAASEALARQARRTSGQTDPVQAGAVDAAADDTGVPADQATEPPSS
ncbi:hypothetical protein ACXRSW_21145 [Aeromonas dhakensis]|uniref:Uncharacterized protein n=1 Tax=Aeromonas dhakensis TaxID=196024 RepID=K1K4W8_9GAMM|nr:MULTISPECIES: hypothetical protein [Aeromonas]MDD9308217.1 hypothetical protein [Aeromonas hydrophila]EKB26819.1 hypothetical protein HMPREF1171_03193 [Aeromonas dhakensis]MBF8451901.1 hypothetical protein [Aeromonas dhakensis]MBL0463606.1 hypothetical protein [Aeromonas dhakensis]MBL0604198.1 hypothetical protein [Aeromonas dhakensis]